MEVVLFAAALLVVNVGLLVSGWVRRDLPSVVASAAGLAGATFALVVLWRARERR